MFPWRATGLINLFLVLFAPRASASGSGLPHPLRFAAMPLGFLVLPVCGCQGAPSHEVTLVGRSGLEPPTSRLSGECSNQLS